MSPTRAELLEREHRRALHYYRLSAKVEHYTKNSDARSASRKADFEHAMGQLPAAREARVAAVKAVEADR